MIFRANGRRERRTRCQQDIVIRWLYIAVVVVVMMLLLRLLLSAVAAAAAWY
jgi:hypothetical protein